MKASENGIGEDKQVFMLVKPEKTVRFKLWLWQMSSTFYRAITKKGAK